MASPTVKPVLRTDYQRSVAEYRNREEDPVNIKLGEVDGLYHHHYGLGDYDPAVPAAPEEVRDEAIIAEMHRLETAQANVLLDAFGDVPPVGHLMDGGSGRGGTSFMANARFGVQVDGVGIWTNETTMYVDLQQLYGEFARLIAPGGRYACITGCYNDLTGGRSRAVSQIDQHYICNIHARSEYFRALADNGFVPISVVDLTPDTIPYWELRAQSNVVTGVEEPFLTAYEEGSFHYLLIVADRI